MSREVIPLVGAAAGAFVLASGLAVATGSRGWMLASGATLLTAFFLLYFFRDPDRESPAAPQYILSAADGRVAKVAEVMGEGGLGPFTRVSVFLSVFDVHVNRMPADGVVRAVEHRAGRFLAAFRDAASRFNEQNRIEIDGSCGRFVVTQIAGAVARRIVCRIAEGQRVRRGERFGMIRFGSRVEVLLPRTVRVLVKEGDKVRGGITPIGVREDAF